MPTRSSATRDGTPTFLEDAELKTWDRKNLQQTDWDFSELKDFPSEHLRLAWLYEIDRELGSGNTSFLVTWKNNEKKKRKEKLLADINGTHRLLLEELLELVPMPPDESEMEAEAELKKMLEKPDMSIEESKQYDEKERALNRVKSIRLNKLLLSEATTTDTKWKPPIPKEPEPILKSYDQHEFCEMPIPGFNYRWVNGDSSSHCTIHPLEIDWTLTETELVMAFRNWLRKGDHSPFRPNYKQMTKKVGKRKTASWVAWLRELAIYRISEAGFTRAQGLKMLKIAKMSPANWEHAQARTRTRLEKEKRRCEFTAWNQGQGSPDDWRDCFVKPFGYGGL